MVKLDLAFVLKMIKNDNKIVNNRSIIWMPLLLLLHQIFSHEKLFG